MRVRLVRCLAVTLCAGGCVPLPRGPVAPPTSTLPLQRVVLYRSGVAYFERGGGARDSVVLRTRREHLSDLLKSLSVRHANNGALLSAHTPLAPSADGPAVAVPLRLGAATGEIVVSYVTGAPTWQASYRIVLPESGDDALLQAFAIVPNQSGDDWHDVRLSLSTSVPMSFRYDLHTPREVSRPDLGPRPERRAEPADKAPDRAADRAQSIDSAQRSGAPSSDNAQRSGAPFSDGAQRSGAPFIDKEEEAEAEARRARRAPEVARDDSDDAPEPAEAAPHRRPRRDDPSPLRRGGGERFDLAQRLSLPDGSVTLTPLFEEHVPAEQSLLFRPGGSGAGFAQNPYRIVRFRNRTSHTLPAGPLSVFAGGGFVGEGLADGIVADAAVIVPLGVEPSVSVTATQGSDRTIGRARGLASGTLLIDGAQQNLTRYRVACSRGERPGRLWLRHPRTPGATLTPRPPEAEDLADAYLVPVTLPRGPGEVSVELIEQRPQRGNLSLTDERAEPLLHAALAALPPEAAAPNSRLNPLVVLYREVSRSAGELSKAQEQQQAAAQRLQEARAARETPPPELVLRQRLLMRQEAAARDAEVATRRAQDLANQHRERRRRLMERARTLTVTFPGADADPRPEG